MSTEAKIESMRRRYARAAAEEASSDFDRLLDKCDSPIEQMLVGELLAGGWLCFGLYAYGMESSWDLGKSKVEKGKYFRLHGELALGLSVDACAYFYAQFPLRLGNRSIRLDAAVALQWWSTEGPDPEPLWFAIECDGHDFHERTKQQAAHDRSRDRALTAAGWRVVRFTGSELHANAPGCVDELIRIILSTKPGSP